MGIPPPLAKAGEGGGRRSVRIAFCTLPLRSAGADAVPALSLTLLAPDAEDAGAAEEPEGGGWSSGETLLLPAASVAASLLLFSSCFQWKQHMKRVTTDRNTVIQKQGPSEGSSEDSVQGHLSW